MEWRGKTLLGPYPWREALLQGDQPGADEAERAALAQAALAAVKDGSRTWQEVRALAARAPGEPAAGLALICCDAFGEDEQVAPALPELRYRQGRLREARGQLGDQPSALLALCQLELGEPPVLSGRIDAGWLLARASVAAAAGDTAEALQDALECGRRLAREGALNPAWSPWRSLAAELALRRGDRLQAVHLAAQELVLARSFGAPRAIGIALRASGLARASSAMLEESVAVLRASEAELELARSLLELGALLRRGGDRLQSREHLRAALDLAERLGAALVSARAREELRASGAKPRRDMLSGVEALTPSELRVAELVCAGRSTREIAQELFVTMRTVSTHLTHVYQKLDIPGREQLPAKLARHDGAAAVEDSIGEPDGEPQPDPVSARDGLSARALDFALALAVLGQATREVHFAHARALAQFTVAEAEEARSELAAADLIEGTAALTFIRPAVPGELYDSLSAARRIELHHDAARLMSGDPRLLRPAAAHLGHTPPAEEPSSVLLLRAAASAALAEGKPQEAVTHLRRALSEPPAAAEIADVNAELAAAEAVARDPAAARRCEASGQLARLAEVHYIGGRSHASQAAAARAIHDLGAEVDPRVLAPIECIRGCAALTSGEDVGQRLEVLRPLAVAAGDAGLGLTLLDALRQWRALGPATVPGFALERGLEGLFDPPGLDCEAIAGLVLAMLVSADDRSRSGRFLDRVWAQGCSRSAAAAVLLVLAWSSHLALRHGQAAAAVLYADAAAHVAEGLDVGGIAGLLAAFRSEALLERGDPALAAAVLDEVDLHGLEARTIVAYVHFARAGVALAEGQSDVAVSELEACRTASRGVFVDSPTVIPSRSALALALAAVEPDRARALVTEELMLARRVRSPRAIGVALHARGVIDGDAATVSEAVPLLRDSGARLAQARALAALASLTADRTAFEGALAAAIRCGATALATRLVQQLADRQAVEA